MIDRLIVQIIDDKGRLYHRLFIPVADADPEVMAAHMVELIKGGYTVREDSDD